MSLAANAPLCKGETPPVLARQQAGQRPGRAVTGVHKKRPHAAVGPHTVSVKRSLAQAVVTARIEASTPGRQPSAGSNPSQ
jgi:hypothetical protein